MKLNSDSVRGILTICLEKEGFTIEDLEAYLSNEKTASDGFGAKDIAGAIPSVGGGLADILKVLAYSAATVGGVAGLGGYGAIKGLQDSDNRINEGQETKRKIDAARKELEAMKHQQHSGM